MRRRNLSLGDLYLPHGRYHGWNVAAIVATLAGCALAWGGLVVPALKPLYDYGWFVGFATAALVYLVLGRSGAKTEARVPVMEVAPPGV